MKLGQCTISKGNKMDDFNFNKAFLIEKIQGVYDDILLAGLGIRPLTPDDALHLLGDLDKIKRFIIHDLKVGHKKEADNV
jgi:hypothetical protein